MNFICADDVDATIFVNSETFSPSDLIDVSLYVESIISESIDFNLISSFGGVCEGINTFQEFVSLGPGESREVELYSFILPDLSGGKCEVVVSFIYSDGSMQSFYETFDVEGSDLLNFNFNLLLDKKVFVQNENISLDYYSDVSDLAIDAFLVYPDDSTEDLELPVLLELGDIGSYSLYVNVSKDGYESVSFREQFGIIKGGVVLEEEDFSELFVDGDSVEEGGDNGSLEWGAGKKDIVLLVLIILVILLFVFVRYLWGVFCKK